MHAVHHDRRMSRLFLDAVGFWDVAEAMAFYTEVTIACRDAARAGTPLTLLSDITDYLPQGGPVSDVHARTAAEFARAPIARYVLVADKALNRMRARRLLEAVPFEIASTRAEAAAMLGWSEDYLRRLPVLERPAGEQPSVLTPVPAAEPPAYGRAAA
jgi:hypothetical protein